MAQTYGGHSGQIMVGMEGDTVSPIMVDSNGNIQTRNLIWNASSLAWEKATGSLAGGGVVTVNNFPATQPVTGTFWQVTQPVSASSLPLPSGASTSALQTQPGIDIGDVTVNNASGVNAVNVQDGGNSLTIDGTVSLGAGSAVVGHVVVDTAPTTAVTGTFFQATQPISASSLPLPTGAATSALQTQPGIDIGDVTINNASGGSSVNIQDGGNSITVDGTVTSNQGAIPWAQTGTLTHNNAIPGTNNIGVLPALANASAPTYIEGDQVLLSTTLGGALRISGSISASSSATATENEPTYTEADTTAAFSQTLKGYLRSQISALVDETTPAYLPGVTKPISMTPDGRLRVITVSESFNLQPWQDLFEMEVTDRDQCLISAWA